MAETDRPDLDRAARRAERARLARLSRLPFLYDLSLRSRGGLWLALGLQMALTVAVVLVPAHLLTGSWLPPGAAFLVLAAAFGLQWVSRYVNAKAGRA